MEALRTPGMIRWLSSVACAGSALLLVAASARAECEGQSKDRPAAVCPDSALTLRAKDQACPFAPADAQQSARPCGASGLRIRGGKLWTVLDKDEHWLVSATLPRGPATKLERTSEPVDLEACKGAIDSKRGLEAEALAFQDGDTLFVGTDHRWLLKLTRTRAAPTWTVAQCWAPPRVSCDGGDDDRGFEAVFVHGQQAFAILECRARGSFWIYAAQASPELTPISLHWSKPTGCVKDLRIADAVETPRGALLLASCETTLVPLQRTWAYFIALLEYRAGANGPELAYPKALPIRGTEGLNLEGIAVTDEGDIYLMNDDWYATRHDATKLWKLTRNTTLESFIKR